MYALGMAVPDTRALRLSLTELSLSAFLLQDPWMLGAAGSYSLLTFFSLAINFSFLVSLPVHLSVGGMGKDKKK